MCHVGWLRLTERRQASWACVSLKQVEPTYLKSQVLPLEQLLGVVNPRRCRRPCHRLGSGRVVSRGRVGSTQCLLAHPGTDQDRAKIGFLRRAVVRFGSQGMLKYYAAVTRCWRRQQKKAAGPKKTYPSTGCTFRRLERHRQTKERCSYGAATTYALSTGSRRAGHSTGAASCRSVSGEHALATAACSCVHNTSGTSMISQDMD